MISDVKQNVIRTGVPWYRFEPNCEQRLNALVDNKLWISDPNIFNDPFDFNIEIKKHFTRTGFEEGDVKAAAFQIFNSYKEEHAHWMYNEKIINEILHWAEGKVSFGLELPVSISEYIKSFGVQCFSQDWNLALSWAHYASQHKGFCIEYDMRQMDFALANNQEMSFFDVVYTNTLPELCLSEVIFTPHQAFKRLLSTKTVDWAYEQEARIVHFHKQGEAIDMPEGLKMVSLTAGYNMSSELKEQLMAVARSLGLEVFEMVKSKYSQTFERKRINQ